GHTPMEWIIIITIAHAKRLLSQPDIQVKEVADQLGFPEQFTFRKYFKQHTGMSPRAFRERN
ncbi:MAG: helix-turn-helix transcriptional regulator, partial [Bacteroidales bacterium]|nr:helix-turn-helix transcriptional regulator [Bacteroidales bacterium]